ncbi:membrane protein DedA with SNARE-associated domain [Actinoalloteichus hoggarensis]|uniref:Inner membrane protein YqjA n=1 Tax=Actinoalloteichus hoggarensis TaxID=1470176 RepID=A0A221W9Q0_9PSEU|nr:VTT domain-containing protein [Actinoalloteichus hoggarensis]ASO22722.1 Inner membrane protein YqjA [Actinoalloteichus hoggarensis]MBB5924135.1 membrane protein DedA with SNARE-associated domain [Actinoalloteichus hoggarensis]
MPDFVNGIVSYLTSLDPAVFLIGLLVIMILETSLLVGLVVPGDVAVLVAAATLGWEYGLWIVLISFLGTLVGQSGGYLLGRLIGDRIRRGWIGRKMGDRRWAEAESIATGDGARAMITTRFVAVVHSMVPVVVGSLGLSYLRFIRLATLGAALWAVAWTGFGLFVGGAGRAIGHQWGTLGFGVLGILVSGVVLWRSLSKRRREHARAQEAEQQTG